MQERTAKLNATDEEPKCAAKRRKLEDIENQAMVEKDSEKFAKLFEEYREEDIKTQGADDDTTSGSGEEQTRVAGWLSRKGLLDHSHLPCTRRWRSEMWWTGTPENGTDPWPKTVSSLWGDVNDMELPLDLVKMARKEEMEHMKGRSSRW